ncbi:glycosyltransferase [Paenibacillus sp. GCM10023248]|uniref:glycosyltransferase n=1 Tax=unclassified Paenibacillus TaxID=185978 RepID=UPI0023782DC4|nr:glycosyltransferase [Paenibacillus sp. MAHUQ-63]MDD9266615.1 glycosyltransferase [Paenibacillus sp. MAHUQ-63]
MFNDFDFNKIPGSSRLKRVVINSGKPLVSIITPFYNSGKYFQETINCILNQTFPYFEWIIVNDGSTNTNDLDVLKTIEKLDSRISVFEKENGGISSARNFGIKKSCTDIIIPLDADDLIEPTYIECIYWSLYTNPDASWSYTDCIGFFEQEYLWKKPFITQNLIKENFLTCTAGIRKQALLDVGLYNESEKHYNEDWNLWLKLMGQRKIPVHMGWYGFWYRRTDQGVLGIVKTDKDIQARSRQVIESAAKKVDTNLQAIEYPRFKAANFAQPKKWEWDRPPIFNDGKMKVLMLLPHMEMGGADAVNLDIVSRIKKEEFEVSIITTNPAASAWRQRFEENVTDVFDLTTFLDVDQWSAFIHYFIKSRKIDVLFLSNSYYGYYLVPWLRKEFPELKIVDLIHMEEWYWRSGGYARTSRAVGDIIEKTYVSTGHLKNVLIQHFGKNEEDVETIYTGVDSDVFDPQIIEEGQIRKQLNIENHRKIVLFSCRMHPQKRPFLMVEIAKELRRKMPDVAFLVVGDGPQYDELIDRIKKEKLEKTVYMVGRQQDLRPYYKDSDIALICSIKEGISLTTYEALAMGVPVISSDVGGQKELINTTNGRILKVFQNEETDLDNRQFEKEEIMQYVDALETILNSEDLSQIKSNCRTHIINNFTKNQMVQQFEEEFRAWATGKGNAKRAEISNSIQMMPNLVDDYLTIYHEYLSKDLESEQIWNARVYFEELYKKNISESQHIQPISGDISNTIAIQELNRIYEMRSWKLVQKYRLFMDNTQSGKIARKIRNLFLRK